jgi:tetratricopeptide (TPR) repeat protein
MVRILVQSAVLAGAVLVPFTAFAQARLAASAPPAAAQRVDSVAVLRQARSAQSAFEYFRHRHLPIGQSYQGGSQRCDARVGRFCFWLDDEDDRDPPPEPRQVAPRRAELLAALDRAAATLPGDGWIAGQRVRYLSEAGHADRAVGAARACRADPWWCSALEGYALHDAGRYADAEAAFARALQAMPAGQRAEWTDLQRLLPVDGGRIWRRAGEGEREALARRLWWLADPLWSEPGNDRWTEHGARWVFHRLQDRARTTENFPWGDDSGELLVRYGRHVWWERYAYGASMFPNGVISYIKPFTREFLPPASAAVDPSTLKGTAWDDDGEPDASRYAPAYARRFVTLPHDFAVFRRGDQVELVAAYAMKHDSLPAHPRVRAAVVAMEDVDAPAIVARATGDSPSGALRLRLAPGKTVVSLEVREESSRIVGRWREALALARAEHASDLLLLSDAQARPTTLDEAGRLARGSGTVAPGETLAVYWELYDVPPGTDTVGVALQLVPGQPGWGRRQLEAVGLARAGQAVSMRWNEEAESGPIVGRSLGVGLPPDLRPGEYTLDVEVRVPGRAPVVIRRALTVARPRDEGNR